MAREAIGVRLRVLKESNKLKQVRQLQCIDHIPYYLPGLSRHILHSLDRTQLIYTCILLSFSLSLIIHDSQVFKTKIQDSYMFCMYDS